MLLVEEDDTIELQENVMDTTLYKDGRRLSKLHSEVQLQCATIRTAGKKHAFNECTFSKNIRLKVDNDVFLLSS